MLARPTRPRGFSLLELVIALVVVALLTVLAIERLRILRVEAERAATEQVLGGLRAAVTTRMLALLTGGRDDELLELPGSNPMDYLLEPPINYRGELRDSAILAPGSWGFDHGKGQLVYRPRYARWVRSGGGEASELRFEIELAFDDRDGDGRFDPRMDGIAGARLVAEQAYEWLATTDVDS